MEYGGCRDMSDINRLMRCRFQPLRPADTSPIFCVAKHRGGVSDSHSKAICNIDILTLKKIKVECEMSCDVVRVGGLNVSL